MSAHGQTVLFAVVALHAEGYPLAEIEAAFQAPELAEVDYNATITDAELAEVRRRLIGLSPTGWQPVTNRWESRRGDGSLLVVKPASRSARTERGTPYSWVFAWYGPAGGVLHGYSRTEFYNSAERAMDAAEAHFRRALS